MNEPTFFEIVLGIVTLPLQLVSFLTTRFLEFIFFDLFNLGTGTMM